MLIGTILACAGVGTGLAAYGVAVEPYRTRVVRRRISPEGWRGGPRLRVAALADIHADRRHMGLDRIAGIVETTNALDADVIVLLGDYCGSSGRYRIGWDEVAPILSRLHAPLGVLAIAGNHEWWDGFLDTGDRPTTCCHRAFAAHGIPLLENDAVRLEKDGRPFWVAGLGDQIAYGSRSVRRGVDDLPRLISRITDDAPALLLAHEPDIFPKVPARFGAVLCGHTHAGQVRLAGWSPLVPSRHGNRYAYGHVVEGGRHLVVSGGLGTSSFAGIPVRLGAPPEILLLDFVPPAGDLPDGINSD